MPALQGLVCTRHKSGVTVLKAFSVRCSVLRTLINTANSREERRHEARDRYAERREALAKAARNPFC